MSDRSFKKILGIVELRDLILSLLDSLELDFDNEAASAYFPAEKDEIEIGIIVREEEAEKILNKLVKKGFVGKILEEGEGETEK